MHDAETQLPEIKTRRPQRKKPAVAPFTPAQGRYLAFIDHYIKVHRKAPAEADMQAYFQTSPPTVHQMVITLERNNLISRTPGIARSIKILVPPDFIPDIKTGEPVKETERFPHIIKWLKEPGRSVSLGYDHKTGKHAHVLDADKPVWNGGNASDTIDELLTAVNAAIVSLKQE